MMLMSNLIKELDRFQRQGDWKKLYQSRADFSSLLLPLNAWANEGEQGHSKAIKRNRILRKLLNTMKNVSNWVSAR